MTHELVQKLREIIDEKHRRAIEALETIGTYLDEVPAGRNGSAGLGTPTSAFVAVTSRLPPPPPGSTSIRGRVLECLKGPDFASVDTILATYPTLDKKQIWGVITAPDLKDRIERVQTPEGAAYRLKPKSD
jgi:hypothetical protein